MQICAAHWKDLKDEVAKRGLWHLVAKDGKAAAENLAAELTKTEPPAKTFDPLMNANFAILHQFIDCTPEGSRLNAFMSDACPICSLVPRAGGSKEELQRNWIEGAVQDQYDHAEELGLIVKAGRA